MNGRNAAPKGRIQEKPKGFDDYELVLGDILRGERATMGKSLLDVQRDIKIRASYVAAIEGGDLSAFETPGFIAGYVRSYGRYLGLEPDLVYQAFCEETGFSHIEGLEARAHAQKRPEAGKRVRPVVLGSGGDAILKRNPLYTAPRPRRFGEIRPAAITSTLALILVLGGLGYGAWSVLQSIQRVTMAPVDTPVATLDTGDAPATDATEAVANTKPDSEALMRLYRPQALQAPVMVARDGPISTLDPNQQGVFAGEDQKQTVASQLADLGVAGVPAQPGQGGTTATASPLPPGTQVADAQTGDVKVQADAPPGVVLFARDAVWLRVSSANGTVLFEKTLKKGESYQLPQTEVPPSLRAGNSGSLYFAVNGETFGPAGPAGGVVKNVKLSVADLEDRYKPANMQDDPELRKLAELVLKPETPPVN